MQYPVFVGFHFDRAPKYPVYKIGAEKLQIRCDELGIKHDIQELDLWDYVDKYRSSHAADIAERRIVFRYIPIFIRKMLKAYNSPILYIHGDSRIIRKPDPALFTADMDVEWSGGHDELDVWASPIYLRPSSLADTFLDLWEFKCQRIDNDISEHPFLLTTLDDLKSQAGVMPFNGCISSERPVDDPDILYGQGIPKPKFE